MNKLNSVVIKLAKALDAKGRHQEADIITAALNTQVTNLQSGLKNIPMGGHTFQNTQMTNYFDGLTRIPGHWATPAGYRDNPFELKLNPGSSPQDIAEGMYNLEGASLFGWQSKQEEEAAKKWLAEKTGVAPPTTFTPQQMSVLYRYQVASPTQLPENIRKQYFG